MSAQDRLKETITLKSPSGVEYVAKWAGNNRSADKKLGIFDSPKTIGSVVQDLDLGADRWPLTLYFDSEDHDLDADNFIFALRERGPWLVEHPTKGFKSLQLMSYVERIQPITDGNYTRVDTEWIEGIPEGTIIIVGQLASEIENQGFFSKAAAAAQFVAKTVQDTVSEVRAISVAASRVVTNVRTTLRAIENFEIIPAEFEALVRGINSTIESVPINTTLLSGQLQSLVGLFAPSSINTTKGVEGYQLFAEAMVEEKPDLPSTQGSNQVAVQELVLAAASNAVAQTMLVGGEKTRIEAINNAESILAYFKSITDTLDATQKLYETQDIDLQYFSQSDSYATSFNLATIAARFKFQSAFDLAVEKKILLDRDRTPIGIAMTEYTADGQEWDDAFLDEFIDINGLVGNQILLLTAGDVVVVYV